MPTLFKLTEHRTRAPFDAQLSKTYLGQAHIAGTGPAGKTCRECKHWHLWEPIYYPEEYRKREVREWRRAEVGHKKRKGEIRDAQCNKLPDRKPDKLIPHNARACRLFEQNPSPPPAKIERLKKLAKSANQ